MSVHWIDDAFFENNIFKYVIFLFYLFTGHIFFPSMDYKDTWFHKSDHLEIYCLQWKYTASIGNLYDLIKNSWSCKYVFMMFFNFFKLKESQSSYQLNFLVMKHYLLSMWHAYQQKSSKEEQTNIIYYICIAFKAIYLMDESH